MKTWTRMPVFRIFLPFAAGILIGFEEIISLHLVILPFALASLISLLFTLKRFATGRHATRWLAGIPWTLTWLTGGILTSALFISGEPDKRDYAADSVIAVVDDYPRWGNQSVKFPARAIATAIDSHTKAADFTIMVSARNGISQELMPGDLILLPGRLRPVNTSGLPGTFDYKAYLLKKGIRSRITTDGGDIRLLKKGYEIPARHFAAGERSALAELLKTCLPDSATLGITCALVLGDERWLEDEVESGYAGAGVLHVLCVSGMHVVLLLSVAEKLISLIRLRPGLKRFRYPVLMLLTWYYTSLTGFTPSIVRAAMMMTLVLTGKMLQRPGNMPNMLASCVLVLVIFDPSYLVNAGFQLSFLAVAGIVFIHERLRWVVEPSTKAGKWIWDMISVSLAAQLATFPLSMYYFHQFPNYFLLANLIIVPVSTLVLYMGMLLVMVSWIPQVSHLLAFLITKTVYFLNGTALWISSLPCSISGDLFITIAELILLSALIFAGFMIGRGAAKTRAMTLLILANGLLMCRNIQLVSSTATRIIVTTGIPVPGAMGIVSGRSGLVIVPKPCTTDPATGISTYMKSRFADQVTTITIEENQYVSWDKGGERYLYLSALTLRTAEALIHKEKPEYLIAGSHRGKKQESAVKAMCDSAGIRLIHLKAEGSQLWNISP